MPKAFVFCDCSSQWAFNPSGADKLLAVLFGPVAILLLAQWRWGYCSAWWETTPLPFFSPLPSGSITWVWPASFCHSYFPREHWIKFPMTLTGEIWSNGPSQGAKSHQHNTKRIKKKERNECGPRLCVTCLKSVNLFIHTSVISSK